MRWLNVIMLGSALTLTSGCTNSILGVLLAPEGVIAGGASSLAEAGAQTLSGASLEDLSDLGNTITELDRIIAENPDAVNADQLRGLRDHLKKNATAADSGPDQRVPLKEPPAPRRPTDAKLPVRKSDHLTILPPGEGKIVRRAYPRPDTLPDGSALRPDPTPVHTMSLRPVRLPR